MGLLANANPAGGSAPLPGFLSPLVGPLDHYGYWAIALLLLLENIGVPVIPGEFALIAGAIFAGTGRAGLNVVGVGIVAVIAVIAGAEIGYLIGRKAGRGLVLRYGKYVLLTPHHLDRAEAIVSRYGGIVVVIARYIVGLREANGIIAGITQMRWFTFLVYNVIGACAWVATWLTLGYVAGDHIATIYANVNRFFLYVLIALAVLLMWHIGRRLLRRRSRVAREAAKAGGTAESGNAGQAETREAAEVQEAGGLKETAETVETDGRGAAGTDEAHAVTEAEEAARGPTGSVTPEGQPKSS